LESYRLLGAALVALRDRRNGDDPVLIQRAIAGHGVERLFVRTAEGQADNVPRSWDQAQNLAIRADHLDPGIGAYIDVPGGVAGATVASAPLPLGELAGW
jgi:hypothetical protein